MKWIVCICAWNVNFLNNWVLSLLCWWDMLNEEHVYLSFPPPPPPPPPKCFMKSITLPSLSPNVEGRSASSLSGPLPFVQAWSSVVISLVKSQVPLVNFKPRDCFTNRKCGFITFLFVAATTFTVSIFTDRQSSSMDMVAVVRLVLSLLTRSENLIAGFKILFLHSCAPSSSLFFLESSWLLRIKSTLLQ